MANNTFLFLRLPAIPHKVNGGVHGEGKPFFLATQTKEEEDILRLPFIHVKERPL